MKKIITLLMAALLSVSLCSCGESSTTPDTTQNQKTEDVSKEVKPEADKTQTDKTEETEKTEDAEKAETTSDIE